ncbi:chromate resistance protein ChrB domain-containing protein [Sphingomonas crocodyli]|uniref:Sulfurtransferase n=1 Tax=Sphingomonas crocodyli TaxID=1979270 RepID=A0A437LY85_9SPHN|nr:sulfurtransferase/chromate resistance protein [Sphingomonas crocodyli]RVT90284.1 sulfurtransferase [Sphingomonas crocodyli]
MPAYNAIAASKLDRLVGTPAAPLIIDLRDQPREIIPGSIPRSPDNALDWADPVDQPILLVDADGAGPAAAVAALLRSDGRAAEILDGGFEAWRSAGGITVCLDHLPPRHDDGGTWWVTRARPKIDRIACPWLIRRFVDPQARFLYVSPGDVLSVAVSQGAEPFDLSDDRVFWSHRDGRCTFDLMIEAFGLDTHEPLTRLAAIVRGADTDTLDIAPEAAGLLAISLGLSRSFSDDHAQLEAGMAVYDALYRWSRDAQGEKHDWTSHQPARARS